MTNRVTAAPTLCAPEDLMELMVKLAQSEEDSNRAQRDAHFEAETQARQRAIREQERAADANFFSGIAAGVGKLTEGACVLANQKGAGQVAAGSLESLAVGGRQLASSHETAAKRAELEATVSKKLGEDARERMTDAKRQRGTHLDQMRKAMAASEQIKQQIIRG
jgi:hypothetical protein